jgi:hypothetical protein
MLTQYIGERVVSLQRRKLLETHQFHPVHVSYYCKHSHGRHLGSEIAIAEFSFVDGVRNTCHKFINPGETPIGYAFEATRHAADTNRIPLPPDSFGRRNTTAASVCATRRRQGYFSTAQVHA